MHHSIQHVGGHVSKCLRVVDVHASPTLSFNPRASARVKLRDHLGGKKGKERYTSADGRFTRRKRRKKSAEDGVTFTGSSAKG